MLLDVCFIFMKNSGFPMYFKHALFAKLT